MGDKVKDTNKSRPKTSLVKPDKAELQRATDAIQSEIAALQEKNNAIKQQIDKASNDRSGSRGEFESARSVMQNLMEERKRLNADKSTISAARDACRDKINARIADEKAARAELKFTSLDAIDKEIKALETRQARTTMSLNDEKKIIKDIKALQQSKKSLAALTDMQGLIDKERSNKAALDASFNEKMAELKALGERISAQREIMDTLNKDNSVSKDVLPNLRKAQNETRAEINAKYDALRALRVAFKEKEDAYHTGMKEEYERRRAQKQKEAEERKAAEEARRKELEEEELKKIPYEQEMLLCDFLVNYLETKFLNTSPEPAMTSDSAPATMPTTSMEGLRVLKRSDEELTVGKFQKRGKKKGGANSKKKDVLVHGVDTIDSFAMLNIVPPANLTAVPDTIDKLREKKTFYQSQERGAVPTIASRLEAERNNKNQEQTTGKTKSVFNLEADFPDLKIAPTSEEQA